MDLDELRQIHKAMNSFISLLVVGFWEERSQVVWLFLCISTEMVVVVLYSVGKCMRERERERERERGLLEEMMRGRRVYENK